jgi:hypothetical protein
MFCPSWRKNRRREEGNALFLILIAIVLFALMTYAFTQSSQGKGATATKEQARLLATQILEDANDINAGVTRLKALSSCDTSGPATAHKYDFTDPHYLDYAVVPPDYNPYPNASAPSNKTCSLYDPAGGNVTPRHPPAKAQVYNTGWGNPFMHDNRSYDFMEANLIGHPSYGLCYDGTDAGNGANGYDATDTILVLRGLTRDVCSAINDLTQSGWNDAAGTPSSVAGNPGGTLANGQLPSAMACGNLNGLAAMQPSSGSRHTAPPVGCVYNSVNTNYMFYYLLVER